MNKIIAKKIIDNFNGDENKLYDAINYIDMPSNEFIVKDYYELIFRNMYLYHQLYGIENISSKCPLPFIIDRNVSYQSFKIQLEKYKNYTLKIDSLPGIKNYFDNILRLSASKLLDMGDWEWTRIFSSKITRKNVEIIGKIYISIDNKDLYRFANLLFTKCLENGLVDYEFKVNNNDSKTRRDNVVIFFTSKNFEQYVSLINQIITENPDITINSPHLFGYAINDNIVVGKDYENGTQSFTKQICYAISELKKEGMRTEKIIEYINSLLQESIADIINLNNELQQNNSSKNL